MADDFGSLGRASLQIAADMAEFDRAMAGMPARVADAERKIRAQMARNRIDIAGKAAGGYAFAEDYAAFERAQDRLRAKLEAVQAVALRAAQAKDIDVAAARRGAAAYEAMGAAMSRSMGRGSRGFGMAALEISRGLEDLQFGIAGFLNNVPQVALALGGGAGLTAAITLAGVAVSQLVRHWGDIEQLWTSDATRKEAERVKQLAEETKKLAEYQEKVADQMERMKGLGGAQRDERQAALSAAVEEVGITQAVEDVAAGIVKAGRGGTKQMNEDAARSVLARAELGEAVALDFAEEMLGNGFGNSATARAMRDPGGKIRAANLAEEAERKKRAAERGEKEEQDRIDATNEHAKEVTHFAELRDQARAENAASDRAVMQRNVRGFLGDARSSQVMDTSAYLQSLQTAFKGGNASDNPMVKKQDEANGLLKEIRDNTRGKGRARFGAKG